MSNVEASGVRRRFRREANRWDQIYDESSHPLARLWDRLTRRNVRLRFSRAFEVAGDLTGGSVLDLGCGSGRYLVEAVSRGAARVVGMDFAPEMIAIARRLADATPGGDRVELVCRDVRDPGIEERFDLVVANGLFDYVPDPQIVLENAWKRARGALVASFPDRNAPRALPRSLYWRSRGVRIRLYDELLIRELAKAAGIAECSIERLGPIFLLVARR